MTTIAQAVYHEATALPNEALAEVLAHCIRLLADRGAATAGQLRTLEQLEIGANMAIQLSFIAGQQSVSPFDSIKHVDDGGEYWLARELQSPLEYTRWEYFQQAIDRARQSCKNSGEDVKYHFRDATKMVTVGSSAQRPVIDYRLSRHACYLILMNGDPRKQTIANAQAYFVDKTTKQEAVEATTANSDAASYIATAKMMILALEAQEQRIYSLEQWRQQCQVVEATPILPAPTVAAPVKSVRAALNELVRSAARRRDAPYHTLWNQLYHELKYRIGFDVEARAANSGRERLDIIEEEEHLEELYAIACEVL
jgi:hypothetical protein